LPVVTGLYWLLSAAFPQGTRYFTTKFLSIVLSSNLKQNRFFGLPCKFYFENFREPWLD
jgi:hypothetical protein